MAIDDIIKAATRAVANDLKPLRGDKDDLCPSIVTIGPEGQTKRTRIWKTFPDPADARRRFFAKIFAQHVNKQTKAVALCYMAWQAKLSDDEMAAVARGEPIPTISSRPNREEVVTIVCMTIEGGFACLKAPVVRREDKMITADDFAAKS